MLTNTQFQTEISLPEDIYEYNTLTNDDSYKKNEAHNSDIHVENNNFNYSVLNIFNLLFSGDTYFWSFTVAFPREYVHRKTIRPTAFFHSTLWLFFSHLDVTLFTCGHLVHVNLADFTHYEIHRNSLPDVLRCRQIR